MPPEAKAKSARKSASARKAKLPNLTFTRVVEAPRAVVWDAWTNGEHLRQWFAPNRFTTPEAEIDLRTGGRMRVVMRAPDGQEFSSYGVVKVVKRPSKFVFESWLNGSDGEPMLHDRTTVTLADTRGKTKLTVNTRVLKVTAEAQGAIDGMEQGWNETLDRLVQFAASLPPLAAPAKPKRAAKR